jgi:hypothetical protein
MRENRQSGSEGGGANPIVSPYPYLSDYQSSIYLPKLNFTMFTGNEDEPVLSYGRPSPIL